MKAPVGSRFRLAAVLLDFCLGEQSHSLQLLQLGDPVLNPLLDDLRHLVHAGSGSAVVWGQSRYYCQTFNVDILRLQAVGPILSLTHVWKL